jgi:phosphate-selective porin OprO/OprP
LAALTLSGCAIEVALAQAQPSAEDRLREMETQMQAISTELEALKKQRAASAKEQSAPVTGKLADGLVLEGADHRWRLRLTGRALLDYRAFDPDDWAADTFSIRQARLGVQLGFLDHYAIYVEGEYSGSSTILSNAYVDFAWWPAARLRFGQFKPLFGLEHTDRVPYFDFTERAFTGSLTQNFLFDRGVMVLGSPGKGFYYGLSLTNGSGQNQDERQANAVEVAADGKDFTGRAALNLAERLGRPDEILQGGFSFKRGKQANSTANPYSAASISTEARGLTIFTPAPFNAAGGDVGAIDRRIAGVEALVAKGPVKLQSEYMQATYQGNSLAAGDFDRSISAWYSSVTWLLTGERYADAYKDGMIARIRPRSDFEPGGGAGAWELGFRYSAFDATDFNGANPANTGGLGATAPVTQSTNKAHARTFGLKWMPNAYARFLVNLVDTRFSTPVVADGRASGSERAVNFRAQVDFF